MQYLKFFNTLDEIYIRLDVVVKIMSETGDIPREIIQMKSKRNTEKKTIEQSPTTYGTISSSLTKKWENTRSRKNKRRQKKYLKKKMTEKIDVDESHRHLKEKAQ